MHDRAIHGDATSRTPCPGGCGEVHPGWASYCHRCKGYLTDLAEKGHKPAEQPPNEPHKHDHPDPVCVVWPWAILANVNDRVAPLGKEGKRARKRYNNRRDAMAAIAAQVANGREPFTGPVRVTLDFYPPDERADTQNFEKAGYDALEGPEGIPGVYRNDKQAKHRISIDHAPVTERPRMEVRVEAIVGGET